MLDIDNTVIFGIKDHSSQNHYYNNRSINMDKLYSPEVIRAINGVGWTVVRVGR